MNKIPLYILIFVMSTFPIWIVHADELKTLVNPEHLANTTQYGYSQATIAAAQAKTIYVAGQIGLSEDGPNDFHSQVDRSFSNMKDVVEAAGGKVKNIVKITLLIKDHDANKLEYLIKKRREFFGGSPPASTLIPVTALALDSLSFEIDAIAVVPKGETRH